MFIRAYLRASTIDQDASRARADVEAFANERGMNIASWYVENESGARLDRPELRRLLNDAHPGDVLLCEQVDRLSRLREADWKSLSAEIAAKRLRVVTLDLPTSWQMVEGNGDEFTRRMADAINGMLLEMLAAIARKDYEDRRRRQAQGIANARAKGVYRGRPENTKRLREIGSLLAEGKSWNVVMRLTGASRATVAKAARLEREKLNLGRADAT